MKNTLLLPALVGVMVLGGAAAGYASLASAQTETGSTFARMGARMIGQQKPHVDGTITAITGSTITLTADANHGGGTYTVNAGNATVTKAGVAATLSDLAVGKKIWAAGTITGTTVEATKISDAPQGGFGKGGRGFGKGHGVMGEVSAVSGSSITVKGKDGSIYTVDAANAKVQKMVAGTLSDIAVGDSIGVQGTVSGTSVTATTIMDDVPLPPTAAQ